MKKIIYVITKSNWGGAQKYVYELATALPCDTYEILVAAGGTGLLFEKLQKENIRTISIRAFTRNIHIFKEIAAFFELVQLFMNEEPDVVHLNSSKAAGLGALAARLAGVKKIIFTAHGWPFLEDRPVWQTMLITFFSWLTTLFATDVIDITEKTYRQTTKWPLVGGKIHLIHNGVRDIHFLDRHEAREKLHIPSETFAVGLIAELTKNKGVAYALRAFELLKDTNTKLFVIGSGELERTLKQQAPENVSFVGFLENAASHLKAFDLLIIPSIKEGLPLTLLEAGLAELPVVATNVGGIPDIIEHEKNGLLVTPKNPQALSEAIQNLMRDKNNMEQVGKALTETVQTEFSFETMLQKTEKLYSSN